MGKKRRPLQDDLDLDDIALETDREGGWLDDEDLDWEDDEDEEAARWTSLDLDPDGDRWGEAG